MGGDGGSGKANRDQHQQMITAGKGMQEAGREPSFGGAVGRGGLGGKNHRDGGAQALGHQESADRLMDHGLCRFPRRDEGTGTASVLTEEPGSITAAGQRRN